MKRHIKVDKDGNYKGWSILKHDESGKDGLILCPDEVPNMEAFNGKKYVDDPRKPFANRWKTVPKKKQYKSEITLLEFRNRFTFDEKKAITSSADAGVKVFMDDLEAMTTDGVNLDSANLNTSMDYVVSLGLLTQTRRDEIMTKDEI